MTQKKHSLMSSVMILALVAAMLMSMTACSQKKTTGEDSGNTAVTLPIEEGATIGTGARSFAMEIRDKDGNATDFTVKTDEKTVGAALQNLGVIEGEEGQYGLYIKTANGIAADYDKDGVYWAFYIDGAYANTSVDATEITDGTAYALAVEKG